MILVGGENLIDFIQDPPDGGYPAFRAVPGGAPMNVAKAAALQGQPVGYLTPVSADALGRTIADDLARVPGLTCLAPASDRPTSLAVVALKDGQARYQFYREGTAERDVTAAGLGALVPAAARALFLGSLAITDGDDAEAWAELFVTQARAGLFTALDPNIRAAFIHDPSAYRARLHRLLAEADLLKLSDEDLAWLAPGEDPVAAARALASTARAELTVLTMGAEGALGIGPAGEVRVPAPRLAAVADTVGAGDTFMGALLAGIARLGRLQRGALAGLAAAEAEGLLATAAQAAAINCTRSGCQPPTLAEMGLA